MPKGVIQIADIYYHYLPVFMIAGIIQSYHEKRTSVTCTGQYESHTC